VGRLYSTRRVSEVMHRGVIACGPEQPLAEVVKILAERQISAVVIVNEAQVLEGVLSTTDLTRAAFHVGGAQKEVPLVSRHLMTKDVIVTWPEEPLDEAVARMMEHHVHRLIVVKSEQDRKHPIGILSMTDLARVAGTAPPPH
jgi:CBS domain-containing protein